MSKLQEKFVVQLLLGYVFIASGIIVNILQLFVLPLWFIGQRNLYRSCISNLTWMHWTVIPAIAQWWSGIDVHLYLGPQELAHFGKEKAIVVMNHKGELDWVISWICSDHFRVLQNCKCMVKSILRFVPIIGWAFWFNEFVFLKRSLEKDRITLQKSFKRLCQSAHNFWMLIFCEGTRFTDAKHAKSVAFAKERGLPPLKYHLLPRTKGFHITMNGLKETVDAVYDVTVVFRSDDDPTLHDLVKAKPCVADVACRRIPLKDIPDDEQGAADFLHQLYREKDAAVVYHKEHGEFPSNGKGMEQENLKDFSKHTRILLPKNKTNLYLLIMWAIVTIVPLINVVYGVLATATLWSITLLFTGVAIVTGVFYLLISAGKPQSNYGS